MTLVLIGVRSYNIIRANLFTIPVDPELAHSSNEIVSGTSALERLDSVAPAETCIQAKIKTASDSTGEHWAWPDSFFAW